MLLKRSFVIALGLFMAMFIVACGGYATTGGGAYSGSNNPPATTVPSTGGSNSSAVKLSVQTDVNGNQVEYNGHPLYTFSGDSAPGQTNGEGITGMWFVATPNLAVQGGGSTSGGYGY